MSHRRRAGARPPRATGPLAVALVVVTAALLALTAISGYARAEFTQRDEFALRVAAALDDPSVREVLAERAVDGLTPLVAIDALAVRPLLIAGVEAVIRTRAFHRVVFEVARRRHGALVDGEGGFVFDLAARGGVLLDAVRRISPRTPDTIPADVKLPILTLRPHRLEIVVVDWITRLSSWWWPLVIASTLMLAACAALAGGAREAIERLGLAVAAGGLVVALVVAGFGSFVVAHAANAANFHSDAERRAIAALWSALFGDLRTAGLLAALGGAIVIGLASGVAVTRRLAALRATGGRLLRSPRPALELARAALVTAFGVALILAPSTMLRVVAVVLGSFLALAGIARIAARVIPADSPGDQEPRGAAALYAGVGASVALAAATIALVLPAPGIEGAQAPRASARACNGAVALCDRRLDEVMLAATHNSFAASDQPGWFFANQRHGIARQLDDGIRGLLIDLHYGVPEPDRGRVRTDLAYEGSSRNKVVKELGPEAVRVADRVAGRVGAAMPAGARGVYLCHTLCELGAEPFGAELSAVRRFLDEHPREVVVLFVEPYVAVDDIEQGLREARLLSAAAELRRDRPLPTLGELIRAGTPLVVLAEEDGGSRPWYLPGFSFVQDTPLGARRPGELSCARARGEADSPLLLINHWIDTFPPSISRNAAIAGEFLSRHLARCERERAQLPNLVAVDFYERTDVVAIAKRFNARSR